MVNPSSSMTLVSVMVNVLPSIAFELYVSSTSKYCLRLSNISGLNGRLLSKKAFFQSLKTCFLLPSKHLFLSIVYP